MIVMTIPMISKIAPTRVNSTDPMTTLAFSRNFGFSQHFCSPPLLQFAFGASVTISLLLDVIIGVALPAAITIG